MLSALRATDLVLDQLTCTVVMASTDGRMGSVFCRLTPIALPGAAGAREPPCNVVIAGQWLSVLTPWYSPLLVREEYKRNLG